MKILITGGNSFIANSLIKEFEKDHVISLTRSPSKGIISKNFFELKYNLYKPKESINEFPYIPQIAILFAWAGTRGNKRNNLLLQFLNYYYTRKLINELISLGVIRFFLAGSQAEYYASFFNPKFSWYGFFKKKTNDYLHKLSILNPNISYINGRFYSVYGIGDFQGSLINYLLGEMMLNNPVYVSYADKLWNYLYVDDATKIVNSLVRNPLANGVIDIASKTSRKLKDYVELVKLIVESESNINYCSIVTNISEIDIVPNLDRLYEFYVFDEEHSFEKGIKLIMMSRNKQMKDL